MGADGGKNQITVNGENLGSELLKIKVYKNENDRFIDKQEIYRGAQFKGDKEQQKIILTFPENVTEQDEEYFIKIHNSKNNNVIGEKSLIVGRKKTPKGKIDNKLKIIRASMNENGKIITVELNKDVENAKENIEALKREIRLSREYQVGKREEFFKRLEKNDKVEVHDCRLIVTLETPIEGFKNSICIKDGALKTNEGLNDVLDHFIGSFESSRGSICLGVEKGYKKIFTNKDRRAKLTLKGKKLIQNDPQKNKKGTVIKVLDIATDKSINNIEIKGEGNCQEIEFDLPENKSNKTKTYKVKKSVDGGISYGLETMGEDESTDTIVLSVLPEGKNKNDVTLGCATIHSYGTNIENPEDKTMTTTPLLQESKKTRIHLYGTNLDKNKTKIKVVDEDNGVEWPVLQDPSKDSYYYFITVAFDGTGIRGNGNHQEIELICPNNMRGDVNYKVYIAPDGKNFDQSTFVRIKVLGEVNSEGEKTLGDPREVRSVTVRYIIIDKNEVEQEIAPKEVFKAYDWFDRDYKTTIKDVKGYKFNKVKEGSDSEEGKIKDKNKVVTYIYSKDSEK